MYICCRLGLKERVPHGEITCMTCSTRPWWTWSVYLWWQPREWSRLWSSSKTSALWSLLHIKYQNEGIISYWPGIVWTEQVLSLTAMTATKHATNVSSHCNICLIECNHRKHIYPECPNLVHSLWYIIEVIAVQQCNSWVVTKVSPCSRKLWGKEALLSCMAACLLSGYRALGRPPS